MQKQIKKLVLPLETAEKTKQVIEQLRESLHFMVELTHQERLRLVKLSRKRQELITKISIYSEQRPELMPGFNDPEAYREEVSSIERMEQLYAMLQPIIRQLHDTIMMAKSIAFAQARSFYNTVKDATKNGIEGSDMIMEDLSYHFKKRPSTRSKENVNGTSSSASKERAGGVNQETMTVDNLQEHQTRKT